MRKITEKPIIITPYGDEVKIDVFLTLYTDGELAVTLMEGWELWSTLSINTGLPIDEQCFVLNHDLKADVYKEILDYLAEDTGLTVSYGFVGHQPVYRVKDKFFQI